MRSPKKPQRNHVCYLQLRRYAGTICSHKTQGISTAFLGSLATPRPRLRQHEQQRAESHNQSGYDTSPSYQGWLNRATHVRIAFGVHPIRNTSLSYCVLTIRLTFRCCCVRNDIPVSKKLKRLNTHPKNHTYHVGDRRNLYI